MFIAIVITTLLLMYAYIAWKITGLLKIAKVAGIVLRLLLPIVMVLFHFFPYFVRAKGVENSASDLLFWSSYLILGFSSILLFIFLTIDFAVFIMTIAHKWAARGRPIPGKSQNRNNPKDSGRRLFLTRTVRFGMIGLSAGLTGYGIFEARRRPAVVKQTIPIAGLPPDFENLRIALISDIHVSSTIKKPFVETVVEITNSLAPDLIAITGDLVDGTVAHLLEDITPLSRLAAPLGIYFVTGNHEYYSGVRFWIKAIRGLGFVVLENEHRIVNRGAGRLLVAGVNDFNAGRFYPRYASSPSRALEGADHHHTRILLAHQPKSIFEAAPAGYHLQLSGHTHGGQYYPWQYLVPLSQPYVSGLHKLRDTWIYTSRGTGYWGPPVRLGSPSEITDIRLVAA